MSMTSLCLKNREVVEQAGCRRRLTARVNADVLLRNYSEETPMKKNSLLLALVAVTALASAVRAIGPQWTPQQLREKATHVITGKADAIYKRTEEKGDWAYTYYIVEIRVDDSEKGEGIEKGDLLYARYWRRAWIGSGKVPPSGMGHRGLPAEGDSFRAYLERDAQNNNNSIFKVVGPNGFEKLK